MRYDGKRIELLKKMYPVGAVVVVRKMEDPHPVPSGTKGVVKHIDDAGQIHVYWDNGSRLALIPDEDVFNIDYNDFRNMEVVVEQDSVVVDEYSDDRMMCFVEYTIKDRLNRYNRDDAESAKGVYVLLAEYGFGPKNICEAVKTIIEGDVESFMVNPQIAHTPHWLQYLVKCLLDSDNNMAFSSDYGMDQFLSDIGEQVEEVLEKYKLIDNGSVTIGEDSYLTIYPSILNHFNLKDWDTSMIDISFIPDEVER